MLAPLVFESPSRPAPKLLDQVREALRGRHDGLRTETCSVPWIRRFILFHMMRHPREMGEAEVEQFLTSLAVEGNVAASTQNQALGALLFLYRVVLDRPLTGRIEALRARRPARLPVVLTRDEVRALLAQLDGPKRLMASLLHGPGPRLLECLRWRVAAGDVA